MREGEKGQQNIDSQRDFRQTSIAPAVFVGKIWHVEAGCATIHPGPLHLSGDGHGHPTSQDREPVSILDG